MNGQYLSALPAAELLPAGAAASWSGWAWTPAAAISSR